MLTAWHRSLLELAAEAVEPDRPMPSEAARAAQQRFALRLSILLAGALALGLAAQALCG